MHIVSTDKAPAAIGPYSQAVISNNFIFCSGQIGLDPSTGQMAGDDVKTQTNQILKNIREVLSSVNLDLNSVVKTTIFLASMSDFSTVNQIYEKEFANHRPARSTVEVSALPRGALVEIECVAEIKKQ